jgi:RNA polymerase sigma-70 factor, ECF subfamily
VEGVQIGMTAAQVPVAIVEAGAERLPVPLCPPGPDGDSDTVLLRAFVDGDERAFAELVRRHGRLVLGLARRYGRDRDEARDLAQQVFVRALKSARRALHGGDVHVRAWLAQIAINLAKNASRDAARRAEAALTQTRQLAMAEAARASDLEGALLQAEREREVNAAVLRLPRRQREVLTLRVDGGLSFREIARALGIAEGNARVQFHHAVRHLRRMVASVEDGS